MILITGCTGFVGTSIVRKALKQGVFCTRVGTQSGKEKGPKFSEIEFAHGSILEYASLEKALEGVDVVINLVGILVESEETTFENVHYHGACNVVDAAKAAGVKRLIHMSALGARENAQSRYYQTKWEAEEYLRKSGLDYTIFRPSVIFGSLDDFVNKLIKIIKYSPLLPVIGSGLNKMQPIWVEDVAECFINAIGKAETIGKTIELGGPEQMTLQEILDTVLLAMGKTRLKANLPLPFLNFQVGLMEKFLSTPLLTKDQLIMMQEDSVCDNTQMKQLFQLEPIRLKDGLQEYLL